MPASAIAWLAAGEVLTVKAAVGSEWGLVERNGGSGGVLSGRGGMGWQSVAARYNSSVRFRGGLTVVEQILVEPKKNFGVVFFNALRVRPK